MKKKSVLFCLCIGLGIDFSIVKGDALPLSIEQEDHSQHTIIEEMRCLALQYCKCLFRLFAITHKVHAEFSGRPLRFLEGDGPQKIKSVQEVQSLFEKEFSISLKKWDFLVYEKCEKDILLDSLRTFNTTLQVVCIQLNLIAPKSYDDDALPEQNQEHNEEKLLASIRNNMAKLEGFSSSFGQTPTRRAQLLDQFIGSEFYSKTLPDLLPFFGVILGLLYNYSDAHFVDRLLQRMLPGIEKHSPALANALREFSKGLSSWGFPVVGFQLFSYLAGVLRSLQQDAYKDRKEAERSHERLQKIISKNRFIGSTTHFKDVIGCDDTKGFMYIMVDCLKNPLKYRRYGAQIPKGMLLSGPPGIGKTLFMKALAGEARNCTCFELNANDLVAQSQFSSKEVIETLYQRADRDGPSLIFIDEIDAVVGSLSGNFNSNRNEVITNLLTIWDGLGSSKERLPVFTVLSTNHPDKLPEALVRPGRIDVRVKMDYPDEATRFEIIKKELKITDQQSELVLLEQGFLDGAAHFEQLSHPGVVFSPVFENLGKMREIIAHAKGFSHARLVNWINIALIFAIYEARSPQVVLKPVHFSQALKFCS